MDHPPKSTQKKIRTLWYIYRIDPFSIVKESYKHIRIFIILLTPHDNTKKNFKYKQNTRIIQE